MNSVLVERVLQSGQTLQVLQGDITIEEVDAVVNAANEHLQHGGGVAWAISSKGGKAIQDESDEWIRKKGPASHRHPAWTSGGLLPAKYVIHAVGPVWGSGNEDSKLVETVRTTLRVADELECSSIALPAISTGIFGFPKERAAGIIFRAIEEYFVDHAESGIQTIRLVLFDDATVKAFLHHWIKAEGL